MVKILGNIEPHKSLLEYPSGEHELFKIMTVENFLRSVIGKYLHFNRVDSYKEFDGADFTDGEQLPKERKESAKGGFEKAPSFTTEKYYDQARSRTYACCFSLENSDFIWKNYGKQGKKGKVCLVFNFLKLKEQLNQVFKLENISIGGENINQIFDINYGIIKYIQKSEIISTEPRNPIEYCYLKDRQYLQEKELRVSLSAVGIGDFILNNGKTFIFPSNIPVPFDFKIAFDNGAITKVLTDKENIFNCTP